MERRTSNELSERGGARVLRLLLQHVLLQADAPAVLWWTTVVRDTREEREAGAGEEQETERKDEWRIASGTEPAAGGWQLA